MKTTHFNLLLIGVLAVVGAIGYFSFSTIRYGTVDVARTPKADTVPQDQTTTVAATAETPATTETPTTTTATPVATATASSSQEHADLSAKITALLDREVQFKEGSKGDDVRVVQEFLNIYDPAGSVEPNGVYGPATKTRTTKFQAEKGLPKSGYAGPKTFTAMKEWLASN
jgi:peptidoglycan hydrolase-like protein with peptidoglycan-binding domain